MPAPSDLEAWDFLLPEEAIARHPTALRDGSRLMQLPLGGGPCVHHNFATLPDLLRPDDLLVVNDTRVMRARLTARRPTGGRAELLVLEFNDRTIKALAKPSKKLRIGQRLELSDGSGARVLTAAVEGVLSLELDAPAYEVMDRAGQLPIPPYLKRQEAPSDRDRYQTVYAGPLGSSAAPTAGLHFTPELLASLATRGVRRAHVTLHVGLGTFRPVRPEDLERGSLHAERYVVSEACVAAIADTRRQGGRVIAVGTTTVRTLEAATAAGAALPTAGTGSTTLFLRPPDRLRAVDGLVTNFHLPKSSLLMLVACLCGRERLFRAYAEAITRGYRFYSYGDAMLLL